MKNTQELIAIPFAEVFGFFYPNAMLFPAFACNPGLLCCWR